MDPKSNCVNDDKMKRNLRIQISFSIHGSLEITKTFNRTVSDLHTKY